MPVVFTPTALRQWKKLHTDVRARIRSKLEALAATRTGDVKRLKGRAGSRLRVGDWRMIFYQEGDALVVVAVGNRRDIYD
jgi:mRNA interferase RelE/StbE